MSVYFTAEVCVLEVRTCCKPYSAEWLSNDLMLLASLNSEVKQACTQLAFGRVFIWGESMVKNSLIIYQNMNMPVPLATERTCPM